MLNLGGSPPPDWLATTIGSRRVSVIQTNGDEHDPAAARHTLDTLAALDIAGITVVTAGRQGALARTRSGQTITAAAVTVDVQQVQGAGAAFLAALIHARSQGQSLPDCLRFACAAGSLWCSRTPDALLPSADDITALMQLRARPGPGIGLARCRAVQRSRQLGGEPVHLRIEMRDRPFGLLV